MYSILYSFVTQILFNGQALLANALSMLNANMTLRAMENHAHKDFEQSRR